MELNLEGKVAIVTGASSGIGEATAIKLAQEGARVALVARRAGKLDQVVAGIRASGREAVAIPADVTRPEECVHVVEETVKVFDGIDIVVNAAGIIELGGIENTKLDDWDYMMNINARAPFYLTQQALS